MVLIPEIRIKDAFLLRQNASSHLHELWGDGTELANDSQMSEIVSSYKKAWQPFEKLIIEGMINILEVNFYKKVLDVYIAPWFYAFSDPLVIGVTHSSDEFIDVLTHELLHVLLTDNEKVSIDSKGSKLGDSWANMFGSEHSFDTLVHIPVHAVHKKVYTTILNDESRLNRDIENVHKNQAVDYIKSWDYVNKNGEDEIIKKIIAVMDNK